MNFHGFGNRAFLFSDLNDEQFWNSKDSSTDFDKEAIENRYQTLYKKAALDYINKLRSSGIDVQIHSYRDRKYRVFDPFVGGYASLTLEGMRITRTVGGKKRTTFLRTYLFTPRGRYLKTDMIMFLAKICDWKGKGNSINSCCVHYCISTATCRNWAKALLLMVNYTPSNASIWDQCGNLLSGIASEVDAVDFLETHIWTQGAFKSD